MDEKIETSCEPMDIDLSSHSVSAMDISYVEQTIENSPIVIKKEKESNKELRNYNLIIQQNYKGLPQTKPKKWMLLCITVLFLSIIYQITYFKCNENLNITQLKDSLSKVHGQTAAVQTLLRALEDVSSKMIILYGGTGVGKTYTASLILDDILQNGNTYHYTMPGFLQTIDFMFGFLICKSAFIVVDDLKKNDMVKIKDQIYDLVRKSDELSKKITILLLFNCNFMSDNSSECDMNFVQELNNNLRTIKINKYFVKYETLNENHLKLCIENELQKKLSDVDFLSIQKNFNVSLDGCKGVYQKIKYLNIT